MSPKNQARLQMTLSAAAFGTIPLFVRALALTSGEIALYRAVIATVLIGVCLLFSREKTKFSALRKELPLLLISGIAIGFNWILLFEAYRYTTVSTATLCYYFAPILVTVLSPILFRERIGVHGIICFVLSTAGVVLLTGAVRVSEKDLHGIALSLGAACLYAAVVLINKGLSMRQNRDFTTDDPIRRTVVQFLAAAIVLMPYVMLTGGVHLTGMSELGWAALLCVGFLHTGAAYVVYFAALRGIPGQEAAVLSYIDPLVAVLLSVFVLGETITAVQMLGGILILGASAVNEILSVKQEKET